MTETSPSSAIASPQEISGGQVQATGPAAEAAQKKGFAHGMISAFILFNLIAIVGWAWPFRVPVVRDVKDLTRPYLLWTGLFQSWDYFAPNPKSTNSYVEAIVITRDRHQLVWTFPAMERLGYFERYREERYRKFTEILPAPNNAGLWPGVARHIAEMFANPADPPQVVLLINVSAPIAPGGNHPLTPKVFYEYEAALPVGDGQ